MNDHSEKNGIKHGGTLKHRNKTFSNVVNWISGAAKSYASFGINTGSISKSTIQFGLELRLAKVDPSTRVCIFLAPVACDCMNQ